MNRRVISFLLALMMVFSLVPISAFALEQNSLKLTGDTVTVDGTEQKTVNVVFSANTAMNVAMLQGTFTEESDFLTLDSFASPYTIGGTNVADANTGSVLYSDQTFAGYNVSDEGNVMTAVYAVAPNTPAGDYEVKFSLTYLETSTGDMLDNQIYTATIKVTNSPVEPAAEGYSVSLQCADPEIIAAYGDTPEMAAVTVGVSNTAANAYNAYNLKLSYPEGLTYVSADSPDVENDNFEVEHNKTARTIQVIGYGANKTLGQSPVTLYFSGAKVGEYVVTLTEAYMDAADNADADDAPEATIQNDTVTVKVTGYTVTVEGEGLSADSWVAVPGQDFTFRATDYNTHNYVVTAMIGNTKLDVTDNNGTYTIEGEDITGNINITATMNPKRYNVTINGEAAAQAIYNTPYEINETKEGHTINKVTVTIGNETFVVNADANGKYIIEAAKVTGDITITIDWAAVTPETVTVNSTGAPGFSGDGSATKGEPYTFSFTEPDKYTYTGLKVEVGEGENAQDITDKLIKNADSSYTIPAEYVTGPITITVTRTEISPLTVEVAQYVKLSEAESIWLVTASGVPEGSIARYDGLKMYWSAKKQVITVDENGEETQTTGPGYGAYAYLVIAGGSDDEVLAEAMSKVTVADKGQETIVTVDYSGDVNCSNKPDINDAQLVYNMYNAHYSSFDENAGGASMLKFLKADLNGDKGLGTQDALVVVNTILSTNNT